jgi:hypothetical protein
LQTVRKFDSLQAEANDEKRRTMSTITPEQIRDGEETTEEWLAAKAHEVAAMCERLTELAAERRHNLSPDMLTKPTILQTERMISFLERQPYRDPKVRKEAAPVTQPAAVPAPRPPLFVKPNKHFIFIPPGRYAVPSLSGNNDLDFFETEHGKPGTKWEGFTFVERIIGGNPNVSIRGEQARRYLAAIEEYGWEASRLLAAQELGVCMDCGNSLTDEESRRVGKGPVCRNK